MSGDLSQNDPSRPERSGSAIVQVVLGMYRQGWFPMSEDGGPAEWVQPHERSVLPLEPGAFRVSSTLAQRVRSGRFEIRSDTAFGEVIRSCAGPRLIEGEVERSTWISPDIIGIFETLHAEGIAHSVEAWFADAGEPPRLVGGLYGLCLGRGGVFCGESMFSKPELGGTDASKVCLVHLVSHLRARGFAMIDAQIANPHTERLGFVERPAEWYLSRLTGSDDARWGDWDPSATLAHVPELRRSSSYG
jgi:leucyl/phenylalanyl-tRNA--protein transferase